MESIVQNGTTPQTVLTSTVKFAEGGSETVQQYDYVHKAEASWSYRGVKLDRYHKRLKAGELLPLLSYAQDTFMGEQAVGVLDFSKAGGYYYNETFPAVLQPGGIPSTSLWTLDIDELDEHLPDMPDYDHLVQEAMARIYSQGFDMLTFAAEFGQIVTMFKRIVPTIFKLHHKRKRGRLSPRDAANSWLEARYGWRILLYEIIELYELIELLKQSRKRYSERAGETAELSTEVSSEAASNYFMNYNRDTTLIWDVSVRGHVVADIEPPKIDLNLAVTAWELIPWSFVLDWVISVGAWIQSLSFALAQRQYFASLSYKITGERLQRHYDTGGNNGYGGVYYASSKSVVTRKVRIPTTMPLLPQIRLDINSFKVVDLIGLLIGLVPKRKP